MTRTSETGFGCGGHGGFLISDEDADFPCHSWWHRQYMAHWKTTGTSFEQRCRRGRSGCIMVTISVLQGRGEGCRKECQWQIELKE